MQNPRPLIKACAVQALAGSRYRNYRFVVHDGSIKYNMLGGEVVPTACKGEILTRQEGWYIQKTGPATFAAHREDLIPVELAIGDKVQIEHAGFAGTSTDQQPAVNGVHSIVLDRKRLAPPLPDPVIVDMTQQLSETKLADGRRGLHVLHDLKFSGYRAHYSETENPWVAFEVEGARFVGTVRVEYQWGGDDYTVRFEGTPAAETHEGVHFDNLVEVIDQVCDSSLARRAKVTFVGRTRKTRA